MTVGWLRTATRTPVINPAASALRSQDYRQAPLSLSSLYTYTHTYMQAYIDKCIHRCVCLCVHAHADARSNAMAPHIEVRRQLTEVDSSTM